MNEPTETEGQGWRFIAPRDELAPRHHSKGCEVFVIEGNGDRHALGYWQRQIQLESGYWYRASVEVKWRDLEAPHLSVFAVAAGRYLVPSGSGESAGATAGRWPLGLKLEREFYYEHAGASENASVELFLKATAGGRVEYSAFQVERISTPKQRTARVATVRFGEARISCEAQLARIEQKLEAAGALGCDIVALPEFSPFCGVSEDCWASLSDYAESVPGGPTCRLLASAARKHKMYVLAGLIERRGKHLFNTAALFDREGRLIGQYDKTHLTLEELRAGLSCGQSYPHFDLDFGRIAIHICYDEWFPEVSRYYAHRGAEILFLPVAGGKPITWRTRALDNRVYFVASSIVPPSMIIDSSGAIIAETAGDGIAYAELNLTDRQTNVYGDPTLADAVPCLAPQMRNCLDDSLLDDLHALMNPPKNH